MKFILPPEGTGWQLVASLHRARQGHLQRGRGGDVVQVEVREGFELVGEFQYRNIHVATGTGKINLAVLLSPKGFVSERGDSIPYASS
jgi:hypothetical protein